MDKNFDDNPSCFFKQANSEQIAVVEKVLATMPEKARGVVVLLLNGKTQVEVSRLSGASQAFISYSFKCFREKLGQEIAA